VLGWQVVVASGLPEDESLGEVILVKRSGALSASLTSATTALAALSVVAQVEENAVYGGAQSQVPAFADDFVLASMTSQDALVEVGLSQPTGTSGHAAVVVAVIDGGFDLGVEALEGRTTAGYDAISHDADPEDAGNDVDDDSDGVTDRGVGHGTAVAALIAVAAPECVVVPIRAFDDEGRGTTFALASAIRAALDAGAKVVNVSGGAIGPSNIVASALYAAEQADVLVVASSGNDGASSVTYPAANPHVLAVTGVDGDRERDPDANVGSAVDLSAFSVGVIAPYPGMTDGYGRWYGTSFSCAAVAAAAARVLQEDEGSPRAVGESLLEAAAAYGSSQSPYDVMGWGVLDASSLLD
jgi:membrane-anchored mycosin MYCP